jgi:hypothetical protein
MGHFLIRIGFKRSKVFMHFSTSMQRFYHPAAEMTTKKPPGNPAAKQRETRLFAMRAPFRGRAVRGDRARAVAVAELAAAAAHELARDNAYHKHRDDKAQGLEKAMSPRASAGAATLSLGRRTRRRGGRFPASFLHNHNFLLFILLSMSYDDMGGL